MERSCLFPPRGYTRLNLRGLIASALLKDLQAIA
jgi:hypothetical protein